MQDLVAAFASFLIFLLHVCTHLHPNYSVHSQEDAVADPFRLFVKEYTHLPVLNLEARSLTSLEFLQATRIGLQGQRLFLAYSCPCHLWPESQKTTSDKIRLRGGSFGPRFWVYDSDAPTNSREYL